ncbi:Secreted-like protein [Daphnia magna]|uniref:Secreted-like protein n=1 Tax=Daphnia magna TaxID=35525 RepID=A0A164WH53_9CRUS|nr:Secreted-like protein [Daphnia magna]
MDVFAFAAYGLLILPLIIRVNGFPNGAPTAACSTMKPGHSVDPQPISTSPFFTHILNEETVLVDNVVRLELRARNGVTTFKGFLVMAFDKDDNSTTAKPIGIFQNAVTHKLNNDKKSVKVEWIRPKTFAGQIVFRTTFVQEFNTFWVKTESKPVSFVTVQPTVTPTATGATPIPAISPKTTSPQPFTLSTTTSSPSSQSHLCWIMKMNLMNIRHWGLEKGLRDVLKDLRCFNIT